MITLYCHIFFKVLFSACFLLLINTSEGQDDAFGQWHTSEGQDDAFGQWHTSEGQEDAFGQRQVTTQGKPVETTHFGMFYSNFKWARADGIGNNVYVV